MLRNIVNNAVKYAPGRPILIACRRRGGRLAIQVYDRGPGIPVEDQAKVFDEFYRVRHRGDRDIEGVGLGLPFLRRLGGLLGLEVTLRSAPGYGTFVGIGNLPIVQAQALAAPPRTLDPPSTLGGLRVLLVVDDEAVLRATASLLETWGCRVQAEPAIPASVAEIDLLITDFELGNGVTGTDCIAAVRRRAGQALPAVVMTGHDEARVHEDLGTADVPILSKPIRPAELRSVLAAASIGMRPRPVRSGDGAGAGLPRAVCPPDLARVRFARLSADPGNAAPAPLATTPIGGTRRMPVTNALTAQAQPFQCTPVSRRSARRIGFGLGMTRMRQRAALRPFRLAPAAVFLGSALAGCTATGFSYISRNYVALTPQVVTIGCKEPYEVYDNRQLRRMLIVSNALREYAGCNLSEVRIDPEPAATRVTRFRTAARAYLDETVREDCRITGETVFDPQKSEFAYACDAPVERRGTVVPRLPGRNPGPALR